MLQSLWDHAQGALGLQLDIADVDALQMALRTAIVYVVTLAVVRIGASRVMGKASAVDDVVAIMLGSIMSRAINGSAPFFPTFASGAVLIGMHWLLTMLAYRTSWFGAIVKGERIRLIADGEVQRDGMRRSGVTERDLAQALRTTTGSEDPSTVRVAYLERSGDISVVPAREEPRVLDVAVKEGVQTVRIELA